MARPPTFKKTKGVTLSGTTVVPKMDLYNAHRPRTFADVVGQDELVALLKARLADGTVPRFMILHGHYGSGKNTIARILAASLLGIEGDPMLDPYRRYTEFSCTSEGGADSIREVISVASTQAPRAEIGQVPIQVLMLDELHGLSKVALSALLSIVESPPSWLYVIAATTDLEKVQKLSGPLNSRAHKYAIKPIQTATLVALLSQIAEREMFRVTEEVVAKCAALANGSARQAITFLDMVSASPTEEAAMVLLGVEENKESEPAVLNLAMTLIYKGHFHDGAYLPISSASQMYLHAIETINTFPNKESFRLILVSTVATMLGLGEGKPPSPKLAEAISGKSSKKYPPHTEAPRKPIPQIHERALGLLEVLTDPRSVAYSSSPAENAARLLVAIRRFLRTFEGGPVEDPRGDVLM